MTHDDTTFAITRLYARVEKHRATLTKIIDGLHPTNAHTSDALATAAKAAASALAAVGARLAVATRAHDALAKQGATATLDSLTAYALGEIIAHTQYPGSAQSHYGAAVDEFTAAEWCEVYAIVKVRRS